MEFPPALSIDQEATQAPADHLPKLETERRADLPII